MEDIDAAFVDPVINRDEPEKKSNINDRNFGNKGGYVLTPFICVFSILKFEFFFFVLVSR